MVLRRVAVSFAGGCLAAALTATVHAQFSATERAAYMAGIRIDRSMLVGDLATSPRSAMRSVDPQETTHEVREVNLIGRGVILEMPRGNPGSEGFQRPRLLIGRQSPELRSWMADVGLPPERCMLPVFRGRLKRAPETGKMGAAVLISGTCSFY